MSNKLYICVRDFQGGSFGMNRMYTAKEWGEQAYQWASQDDWDNPEECLLKNFKSEQSLIEFIADLWEIQLEEVREGNEEIIEYLKEQFRLIDIYKEAYYERDKEFVMKLAKKMNFKKGGK